MNKAFYIILISIFSLTVISCTSSDGGPSTTSDNTTTDNTTTTTEATAPVISEVTVVTTPTSDTTPVYTFSSEEAGTITYGGSCLSGSTSANSGNNTITLNSLSEGTYSDCTIKVTDSAGNASNSLTITSFTVDTTAPIISVVTAVTSPTNVITPSYSFSANEAGTITYGGYCSSGTTSASSGTNSISFNTLSEGSYSNCTITFTDSAGNVGNTLNVNTFVVDTTAPTLSQVTAVTSPTNVTTPNYAFSSSKAGTISYVGCSPGGTSAISGTNSISFGALSDASYSNCSITVTDSAGNASSALSVNTFVVDTTAPTVSSISSSTSNGAYKLNDNITVLVTFNDNVIVDNSSGNPRIQLETGSNDRYANYFSGNSTSTLSFLYTVQSGDNSSDLDYKSTDSLSANNGTIRDNASNNATLTLPTQGNSGSLGANKAIVIDAVVPTIDNVTSSTADGHYFSGDNITVTVTFNKNVFVDNSSGNPRIQLETGSTDRYANYISGNSTSILSFLYLVQSGDTSIDLDYKDTSSLSANSGTIRDNSGNDAILTLPTPGATGSLSVNKSFIIGEWRQEAFIVSTNIDPNDKFGESLSFDNVTLAVGARSESSTQTTITNGTSASNINVGQNNPGYQSGAVYVYKLTGSSWIQEAYIKAANNDSEGDLFGSSVAISGGTLAVGADYEDSNQTTITNGSSASFNNERSGSGAVYVYKRTGTTWSQEAYIKASNSGNGDRFGSKVALSGNTLAVGTFLEDSNLTTITNDTTASSSNDDGMHQSSGAVYIYKRTGNTWTQEAYIKAANNNAEDWFSKSIALDNDTLAVGAMYESSNQTTITNGTGASSDNSNNKSGAVYIYKRTGSSWVQEAYIKAANSDSWGSGDQFGYSVSLSGDTLAVGANYEDSNQTTNTNGTSASSNNDNNDSGAVYIYKRTGSSWVQEAYIKAANNDNKDEFGSSLSLGKDVLAVGAINESSNQTTITNGTGASSDNSNNKSGAVYVYRRTGTTWAQTAYIKSADNSYQDLYGGIVSFSGSKLSVSAGVSWNGSGGGGAVYIYAITGD